MIEECLLQHSNVTRKSKEVNWVNALVLDYWVNLPLQRGSNKLQLVRINDECVEIQEMNAKD